MIILSFESEDKTIYVPINKIDSVSIHEKPDNPSSIYEAAIVINGKIYNTTNNEALEIIRKLKISSY